MCHQRMPLLVLLGLSPAGRVLSPPKCLQYPHYNPQKNPSSRTSSYFRLLPSRKAKKLSLTTQSNFGHLPEMLLASLFTFFITLVYDYLLCFLTSLLSYSLI